MRSFKKKVFKGGAAGITLAAMIGAGTVLGGPVLAEETQESTITELQNEGISDKDASADVIEGMENAGDTENVNEGEEDPSEDQKADDTAGQSSGVSEVKADENKTLMLKNVQDTSATEGLADAEEKGTAGDESVKKGWVYEDGGYKYYKNGTAYTGWHYMGAAEGEKTPHWSYFAKDGSLYTGWHYMGAAEGEKTPHWSYFGSNGWLRTGWVQLGQGTAEPDGNSAKHWSYFGNNGWLRTGWVQMGQGTAEPDGNTAKHWSYFGNNGWLRTGWVQLGKGTSEPDGNSAKHWSYFGNNGWLRTGWVQLGKGTSEPDGNTAKHWSYFGNNGWLRTGLQTMGTASNPDGNNILHLSYFGDNGWLVENKIFTCNNEQYSADKKGWASAIGSGHEKVLAKARMFIDEVTDSRMSQKEKLIKCYQYIQVSEFKRPWSPHYTGVDWPQKYADNWFDTKSGNCFSYAASLGYVAKSLGYKNVYCCNGLIHGWAEIDGLIYDTSENHKGISYDQKADYDYKGLISKGEPWMRVRL